MLTSLKIIDHIHTDTKIIDEISLSYEDRFIRRKKLTANNGTEFLVNLEETKSVDENFPSIDEVDDKRQQNFCDFRIEEPIVDLEICPSSKCCVFEVYKPAPLKPGKSSLLVLDLHLTLVPAGKSSCMA